MRILQGLALCGLLVGFAPTASEVCATGSSPQRVGVYEVRKTPKQRVYIDCEWASEREIVELKERLIVRGAEKVNLFFPSVIVCEIPLELSPTQVIDDLRFSYVEESSVHANPKRSASSEAMVFAKECYDAAFSIATETADLSFPSDFEDRVVINDPEIIEKSRYRSSGASPSTLVQTRNLTQNAEFMIGSILIQLVYPESQGFENTENWTDQELRDANQGAVSAALSFQTTFAYLPLNFVFAVAERVPCGFEPINHSMDDDLTTWIADVMSTLGYSGSGDARLDVHDYNNDGRKRFATDWVYTAFIADSRNEPGNIFSGSRGGAGYTAYAKLGGPFLVMPFPAGQTNPNDLSEVVLFSKTFQHEMIHVFWGLDEYPSAPLVDCGSSAGYLNYLNLNRQSITPTGELVGCPNYVNCLMWNARGSEEDGRAVCHHTRGQIGTVDANGNGIPDVFDMTPIVEFQGAPVETVTTPNITLKMKAISRAVPNVNVFHPHPTDYAAPLKDATIDINGAQSFFTDPDDGTWDDVEEDITFTLRGLFAGLTQIGVDTRNAFGLRSARVIKKIYFIGLNFTSFDFDVRRDGILARWQTVGETYGARFDLFRIETSAGAEDTLLIAPIVPANNPGDTFQRYSFLDKDVRPGHRYRYFVVGTFVLGAPGQGRQYATRSNTFEVGAMLPMKVEQRVSHAAPNPFREATTISVDVPKSFAERDTYSRIYGVPRELPTAVSISVYDVKGRRVKALYSGELFAQVETFVWDGTNSRNERVPSGIYFIKTVAGPVAEIRKVVVVR